MKSKDKFQRVRSKFDYDEEKALASVMKKSGHKKKNLRPIHTEKMFVWEVKR